MTTATVLGLDDVLALHTPPFGERVPEPDEPMTEEENASFAAWVGSALGRSLYAGLAEHIVRLAQPAFGGAALCVAEGEGTLARALARRRPDLRVLGTDVSKDMVRQALARPRPPNLDFRLASAYDLDPVGRADLVVCAFSFHHLYEPERAIAAMLRAVAPGGALFLVDLRRDVDERSYFANLGEQASDPRMARLSAQSVHAAHTQDELRRMLRAAAPAASIDVGRVRWSDEDAAAFLGETGEPLPPMTTVRERIDGMWVEALVRP